MAVHNADIALVFSKIADLLEIQGANPFRVRAYRNAARTIGDLPAEHGGAAGGGTAALETAGGRQGSGGEDREIVESGSCAVLLELEREMPPVLTDLLTLPSLGPKKAAAVHRELGVRTLEELATAAEAKKLRT